MSQAEGSPKSQAKGSLENQALYIQENNDSEYTMLDHNKKYLEKILESFWEDGYIIIRDITAMYFSVGEELQFHISLLEYAVQLTRNKNIPIKWVLNDIYYNCNGQSYIYKKESFWKLIGNGDVFMTSFHHEDEFMQLYEPFLQQISHVQLSEIRIRLGFKKTEKIDEIFEIIKVVTKANLFSRC